MNVPLAAETAQTVRRAIVHAAVGLGIAVAAFLLPRGVMLVVLGAAALGVLLIDLIRLRRRGFNEWFCRLVRPFLRGYESTRLLGATFLIVSDLAVYTVFDRPVAVLAMSYLAIGDPLATVIGVHFGRWKLFRKNLEGVLACLAACLAAGSIWRYAGLDVPIAIPIAGALAAAVAESLPISVDDNLTIPLLSGLVMWVVSFAV